MAATYKVWCPELGHNEADAIEIEETHPVWAAERAVEKWNEDEPQTGNIDAYVDGERYRVVVECEWTYNAHELTTPAPDR